MSVKMDLEQDEQQLVVIMLTVVNLLSTDGAVSESELDCTFSEL
jgi:hypothetical protein